MPRKKGQIFSAEQKSKIVIELLKEEQTISQIASKYGVTPKTLQNWKKKFLENSSLAFDVTVSTKIYKDEIEELKEQNNELAKALGKLTIRTEWAEGKLKSLGLNDKKALIEPKLKNLPISEQCNICGISRSSYYYKPVSLSEYELRILNTIDKIYTENPEYGYRFIYKQLLEDGFLVGRDRVLKYMRLMGIQAIYPKKKRITTVPDGGHKKYPYLLEDYKVENNKNKSKKSVKVENPNEVWSGDITYLGTPNGFVYLAAIIDWNTKAILSYKISNTMDTHLVTDVLNEALSKYQAPKIFNSDQGSQYTSKEHTKILKKNGVQISMNSKGRSIDNIAIERFFRTLKYCNIYINDYKTLKELKEGIKKYIYKYNFERFHSAINYQKPMNVYLETIKNVA
jgi:putative transposase